MFAVFAVLGVTGIHFGWDAEKSEVLSYPFMLGGCLFIGLAGGVFLILLAKGGLLLIDVLMFPGDAGDPPPALYKLPEWYISEGRFEDALAEYEKISQAHPREVECWTGMLDVLVTHLRDIETARKRARSGLRKVRSPEKQETLRQHYLALTGETLKPSWWN